ncbi:MAG TPA: hypothetical protein VII09_01225 [Opitutaceae bacterium]
MPKASVTVLFCSLALLAPAGLLAEPAVVSLARAYLGPQSTLDGVQSIHFVGTLERRDLDHADKAPVTASLDMIFAKPLRQRLVDREEKATRTTVLDGYDAWDYDQSNADPSKHRLTWLTVDDVRTIRANTWENLYYYLVPEGGSVDDKGPATIEGIACERVDFTHGPGNVYERYFDRDTGRLVLTVRGMESIRESGEIRVNGVRFPKTIVSTTTTPSGKKLVATATFDTIVLNEPLAPGLFAVPVSSAASVPGK